MGKDLPSVPYTTTPRNNMAGLFDAISNTVGSATSAVADTVRDGATRVLIEAIERDIEKHAGHHIDVETRDIPSDWKEWMMKTGLNSLATEDSWSFLDNTDGNRRKIELWKSRKIKRIVLQVWEKPDEDDHWITSEVEWEAGWDYFIVWFYPHAKSWSSSNTWVEPGYKTWWNQSDEIEFGLQLYQLPGKCFYKSDWVEGWEDVDPDGFFPWSTSKFRRWMQHRHWIIFWYREAQSGYNCAWRTTPPKLSNGMDFNLDAILSLPSMPNLKMPKIKLPSLPDVSLPSLPSISAPSLPSLPSISAPSLSMPSLSAPNLSAPSIPDKKQRPTSKWAAHGFIELEGLNVKASGTTLILSDATLTNFWKNGNSVDDEKKEHSRLELACCSSEQAESWVETLKAVGAKEGEVGGCCVVA